MCGTEVVLSDRSLAALELLRRNAALVNDAVGARAGCNGGSATRPLVHVESLSWDERPSWLEGAFDVVAASEVMYEQGQAQLVFGAASVALRAGGHLVIAETVRDHMRHKIDWQRDLFPAARTFGLELFGEIDLNAANGTSRVVTFVRGDPSSAAAGC